MMRSLTIVSMLIPLLFGGLLYGFGMDEEETNSTQGWLGVSISDMTARLAKSMHVKITAGALVRDVVEDSPAQKAGLREDDVIIEFQGTKIGDGDDLRDAVRKTKPGTSVAVIVSRSDKKLTLQATMGKTSDWSARHSFPSFHPIPDIQVDVPRFTMSSSLNRYGLSIMDLNKQLGAYFGAPDGRGVLVEEVEKGSPADSAGFKAGDVIIKIQTEQIKNTQDIRDALEDLKEGETASVEVVRKGNSQTLSLRIEHPAHHGIWFHNQSFRIPDFNTPEFRHDMEQLQRDMRDMGREIKSHAREWGKELREELQHRTL